ncbi:MAG: N-acetylmuramoyl-L-alanine amidase [Vicinamibacterales bacterium]
MNIRPLKSAVSSRQEAGASRRSPVVSRPSAAVSAVAAVALLVSIHQLAGQNPSPTPLTLLTKDGRRALAITLVKDQEFVSLDELAAVFQLAVRDESLGALTVSYKGKTIVLTPDQALASVAGRLVSLPAAPTRADRRWLVPIDFIGRALVLIYDARLDLRRASHLLVVGDLRVPRITVRYDPVPGGGGRLTLETTPRAPSAVSGEGNERVTIRFDADALDVSMPLPSAQGLVERIRTGDATTLTIDLGPRVVGFRATTQRVEATDRLTIDLRVAPSETVPPVQSAAPVPAPAPPASPPVPSPPVSPVRTLTTVVIDPGHGGEDQGVKGSSGTREKDVALAVALQLKAAIEGRLGTRVLLTRDDDRQVGVDERASFANNNKADLFISLHTNGSLRTSAMGASIYGAAFDRDAEAPAARPERVPVAGGGVRDIELLPWNRAQARHINRSMAFAAILAEQFHDRVPLESRAVNRAPLRELESANMPAVLIEMGFLSNPIQETQLASIEFQNMLVQAVVDALVRFRDGPPSGAAR